MPEDEKDLKQLTATKQKISRRTKTVCFISSFEASWAMPIAHNVDPIHPSHCKAQSIKQLIKLALTLISSGSMSATHPNRVGVLQMKIRWWSNEVGGEMNERRVKR